MTRYTSRTRATVAALAAPLVLAALFLLVLIVWSNVPESFDPGVPPSSRPTVDSRGSR